jgi:hypothetical protein
MSGQFRLDDQWIEPHTIVVKKEQDILKVFGSKRCLDKSRGKEINEQKGLARKQNR